MSAQNRVYVLYLNDSQIECKDLGMPGSAASLEALDV